MTLQPVLQTGARHCCRRACPLHPRHRSSIRSPLCELTVGTHGIPRVWYNLDGKAAPLRKRPSTACLHCIAPFLGSRSSAHPSHLGVYNEQLYKLLDTESKQGLVQLRPATVTERCTSPQPFERQSATHSARTHKRSLVIDEVHTTSIPRTLLSYFQSLASRSAGPP